MNAAFFLLATFSLLFLSAPIFIALLAPTLLAINILNHPVPELSFVGQLIEGINSFTLLAIPLFIFAADVIARGQIGGRLLRLVEARIGHITGGVAIATAVACALFGAISGVGAAAVVSIGPIVFPALIRQGYSKGFALGLILVSSTLAMLVPPSVVILIFALQTTESVSRLFLSGLCAGLLLTFAIALYAYVYARIHNIGKTPRHSKEEQRIALREAGWALGLPIIIFGGIYSGVFTPTEAAAAACVYAMVVETAVYRQLSFWQLFNVSSASSMTIATLMILISAGGMLSYYLTLEAVPQMISQVLGGQSQTVILFLINIIFLFVGMFIDPSSAVIVFSPLIYPTALAAGIDPIHLGALVVLNVSIGMVTPPMGMNLFLGCMTFQVSYFEAVKGVWPFVIVALITLALVTYVPGLTTWLPHALLG